MIEDDLFRMRGGIAALDRRLGRVPHYDERSLNYGVRPLLRRVGALKEPRSYTWRHVQLDQTWDNTPDDKEAAGCTGFSTTEEAAARPAPVFGDPLRNPPGKLRVEQIHLIARGVYHRARELDPWAGEDYAGSSVLAAVKAGQELGWWKEYRWVLGPGPEAAAQDVILTIGHLGPVLLGTWWYEGMFQADPDGYLRLSGRKAGGHAYLLTGYSKRRRAVWTPNTWGGLGQGWIREDDLPTLLGDDGEGVVCLQRQMPA